jgi:hypothetical protein
MGGDSKVEPTGERGRQQAFLVEQTQDLTT